MPDAIEPVSYSARDARSRRVRTALRRQLRALRLRRRQRPRTAAGTDRRLPRTASRISSPRTNRGSAATTSPASAARAATRRSASRRQKGATHHDLKEFWQIGRELPPGHRYRSSMPDNVWIEGDPGFRKAALELWEAFDRMGRKLLESIAVYLGLERHWFDDKVGEGNSVLRVIHYPPLAGGRERRARGRARGHQRDHAAARRGGGRARAAGPQRPLAARQPAAGNAGVQRRRHAAAADQPRAAVDHAPRRQPDRRAGAAAALLDAVLPALQLGLPDRDAAGLRRRRTARTATRNRSSPTTTCASACARSSSSTKWRSSISTTRR